MHTSRRERLLSLLLAAMTAAGIAVRFSNLPFDGVLRTLLFVGVCLGWGMAVRERVAREDLRHLFEAMAGLCVFFLILQRVKYTYCFGDAGLERLCHRLYYIPFIGTSFLSFDAALRLVYRRKPLGTARVLLAIAAVALCAGVLTNDLHQQCFFYVEGPSKADIYRYGWLYYAVAGWSAGMLGLSAGLVVHRGLHSPYRRSFWFPAVIVLLAAAYFLSYYRLGRPFTIAGYSILQMQEVFCFTIIGFWEACLQTGIIPANADAEALFENLTVAAQVADENGRVCYASRAGRSITPDEREKIPLGGQLRSEGYLIRREKIRGGSIFWAKDIRFIEKTEEERRVVNAQLSEENTLLTAENRMREERAQYETANRLYDTIADDVQEQVSRIDTLMRMPAAGTASTRRRLQECLVLGSYVKRRSNLILISEHTGRIHVSELLFACRESLDSLTLAGVTCGVHVSGTGDYPARTLMLAYDAFEAMAEAALEGCQTLFVSLRAGDTLRLYMETEGLAGAPYFPKGVRCVCRQEGDGVFSFTVEFGKEAA